jgi:hypothetical protein
VIGKDMGSGKIWDKRLYIKAKRNKESKSSGDRYVIGSKS